MEPELVAEFRIVFTIVINFAGIHGFVDFLLREFVSPGHESMGKSEGQKYCLNFVNI